MSIRALSWLPLAFGLAGSAATADTVAEFITPGGTLSVLPEDVHDAVAQLETQGPTLWFRLGPDASVDMAALTSASIGQMLTLKVCGELVVEVRVQERITGSGMVTLDSMDDASRYADRMRGDAPCDAVDAN